MRIDLCPLPSTVRSGARRLAKHSALAALFLAVGCVPAPEGGPQPTPGPGPTTGGSGGRSTPGGGSTGTGGSTSGTGGVVGGGGTGGAGGASGSSGAGGGSPPGSGGGPARDGGRADGAAPGGQDGQVGDGGGAPGAAALQNVWNTNVLHQISITVAPADLQILDTDKTRRVPCTFTFDGVTLNRVGIRRKGNVGSAEPGKQPYSIKTDEFVMGQKLFGLDKMILNNGHQDIGFVDEHIGYELFRRAGLPAPLTSHALVTFNGKVSGIYVVKEAFDQDFLRRNFGPMNDQGNLYEIVVCFPDTCREFVTNPMSLELKNEVEEMRKRDDLNAFAMIARTTPDATWAQTMQTKMNLDQFITGYALEGLIKHWDGYAYQLNNYYLYNNPGDKRFVFLVHGADHTFDISPTTNGFTPPRVDPLSMTPLGFMAKKVWAIPALTTQYKNELRRLLRDVWDVPAMLARIDQVGTIIKAHQSTDAKFMSDLAKFEMNSAIVKRFLMTRKTLTIP
jgi:spore coat protein H